MTIWSCALKPLISPPPASSGSFNEMTPSSEETKFPTTWGRDG
jgi:hypothetical protein